MHIIYMSCPGRVRSDALNPKATGQVLITDLSLNSKIL